MMKIGTNDHLTKADRLSFWAKRATLGALAGTRDLIAKQLEINALSEFVEDGMRILDAGCGNGLTATELARTRLVSVKGFDFSSTMIDSASTLAADAGLKGQVTFFVEDIMDFESGTEAFDLTITERVIINLGTWDHQRRAITNMTRPLKQGGLYLMSENSLDGLEAVNDLRERIGLYRIAPPSWNRYLRDEEVNALALPDVVLDRIVYQINRSPRLPWPTVTSSESGAARCGSCSHQPRRIRSKPPYSTPWPISRPRCFTMRCRSRSTTRASRGSW